jgi:guanine deaminase
LLDFATDPGSDTGTPGTHGDNRPVRYTPDGWLLIEDGRVLGVQPADWQPATQWQVMDWRDHLVCPGFIDTHVHSGQTDVTASFGTTLLQWLEQYTFPNEARYADAEFAARDAELFCDALIENGTTTAAVFPTVHPQSVDGLFAAAHAREMCLVAGKVLMDRHAPDDLLDPPDLGETDSRRLIHQWHQQGRLHYAITPRFAPTSTDAQLALAGKLLAEFDGLYMQTHVAENADEIDWVAELFPDDRSYLSVYERFGLIGSRSLLAHGIYLDDTDRELIADNNASIVFCPSSNLFLGSGLLDVQVCRDAGARVSLASDVGGGTHLSMLRVMADASRVMALTDQKLTAFQAFYQATLGGAQALGLANDIGQFQPGSHADLVVLQPGPDASQQRRQQVATNLHEQLYAMMMLGDRHNVQATLVNGKPRYCRQQTAVVDS